MAEDRKSPVLDYHRPRGGSLAAAVFALAVDVIHALAVTAARSWRGILITLLSLVIALGLALVGLAAHWTRARKVADVPGPPRGPAYELWYAKNGELTFRPAVGNPLITFYDYYGDLGVARAQWLANDHVVLTMGDGTTLDIRVGFVVGPPTEVGGPATRATRAIFNDSPSARR